MPVADAIAIGVCVAVAAALFRSSLHVVLRVRRMGDRCHYRHGVITSPSITPEPVVFSGLPAGAGS